MSEESSLRTPLARAIGLGSAKEGVQHWWAQRLSALALIPLMLWFAASLIAHLGADRAVVLHWLGAPLPAIVMVLVLAAGLYHMALGIQVVIEDYIDHEGVKLAALVLDRFVAFVLAVAGIFAVLRIALGG